MATARSVADAIAEGIAAIEVGDSNPAAVTMKCLAAVFESPAFLCLRIDLRRRVVEVEMCGGIRSLDPLTRASVETLSLHPIVNHYMHGFSDTTSVSERVAARCPEWRDTAAYHVIESSVGATEAAAIRLDSGLDAVHAVCFARDHDYTRDDLDVMDVARDPLIALHHLADRLRRVKRAHDVAACDDATTGLTGREMEVLRLLAQGLLATSIAGRLAISPRTVHRHLGTLYAKLGSHDRLSAVVRAQHLGILTAGSGLVDDHG